VANLNKRSRLITAGVARSPNRAMLRAVGFKDGDFEKPIAMSSPRALAVVRLTTRSNLVGCDPSAPIRYCPTRARGPCQFSA
jgi:hypothetical protein